MKLVLIYGSPAVGKLTVANELAALTGFKVFHNHLTINCVRPIFAFGSQPFGKLVDLFRIQLITEAAIQGVDLIHTFVYAKLHDDPYIERVIAAVEDNGGEICLVLLRCGIEQLTQRVTSESRVAIGKLATSEMLLSLHEQYDLKSPFPGRGSLVIDNTSLSPRQVAEQIIDHYRLDLPGVKG